MSSGHVQAFQRDLDALPKASLATARKHSNQGNAAPVWFTLAPDHAVLIQTPPSTSKEKRICRGSPVIVWIGRHEGPC
jgi:hypothetical protein